MFSLSSVGNVTNGDIGQRDEMQPALNNQQGEDNTPSPPPDAPLMFFNPSQFSTQAMPTPNM